MEPPSTHSITVLNPGDYPIASSRIEAGVYAALAMQGAAPSDVRVLLTDDAEIQRLNLRFRKQDESTDVLTFPDGEAASGDIAISTAYAERQAKARGIQTADEIVFLAIHGALHLAGLNDETEPERAEMTHRMHQVGAELGMPDESDWSSLLHEVGS